MKQNDFILLKLIYARILGLIKSIHLKSQVYLILLQTLINLKN